MCNLSCTPHSNLEKDNYLKPLRTVLAQRWAVWSILTKNTGLNAVLLLLCKIASGAEIKI